RQIEEINKTAGASELFTAVTLPQVIEDLTAGPFNEPEADDDEEFQMIDLETGEAIEMDIEVELEDDVEEEIALFDDAEDEAQKLADALDEAFERLTGEKLADDELSLDDSNVEDEERKIDELTDDMVAKANDLDIDLSFLKDV